MLRRLIMLAVVAATFSTMFTQVTQAKDDDVDLLDSVNTLETTSLLAQVALSDHNDWRLAGCRFRSFRAPRHSYSYREVQLLIVCAEMHFPVAGGASKAISVAQCESGLNPHASNGGRYLGVFQQARAYWHGRRTAYNHGVSRTRRVGPSAFNARSNVMVSIRMASHGGWSGWSCA